MAEFTKSLFRGILRSNTPKEAPVTDPSGETFEGDHVPFLKVEQSPKNAPEIAAESIESKMESVPQPLEVEHPSAVETAAITEEKAISSTSSEDDESDVVVKEGTLSKWTNYVHGWQDRYIVLKGGFLSYFKDKEDTKSLCRATIDVTQASVAKHEFDHARFDIMLSDQVYYLRAPTAAIRQEWLESLADIKLKKGSSSLSRRPSLQSITSTTSATSYKSRTFPEKLGELKTYRDLFASQLASIPGANLESQQHALALKTTTTAMLEALGTCIDMMAKREEEWERKCERLQRRRRRAEQESKLAKESAALHTPFGGPDYVEGPNSVLKEEEYFDALETGLDQLDSEAEREQRLARLENEAQAQSTASPVASGTSPQRATHRFTGLLVDTVEKNILLAQQDPQQDAEWQMVLEDNEMKVYRREVTEAQGIVCDRLKAYHSVKGVTAKEVCQYFFDTKYRMEWEHTVEKFFVLERFSSDTLIFHNLHKRIWPSAQRDSCCLSHIRDLGEHRWLVQNISVEHEAAPKDKCVRVDVNIMLIVSTTITKPKSGPLTRDHVSTRITYMAYVNPGGWVPPAALRAVSKREYPKFLRTFTAQCLKHYSDKPLLL